ncbi:DNA internalization-related competence protein ComEC/Rec2 [compost metagenome]
MSSFKELAFVKILCPFIAGIGLSYPFLLTQLTGIVGWVSVSLYLLVFVINRLYIPFKAYRLKHLTGLCFCMLFFTFGVWICLLNKEILHRDHFSFRSDSWLKADIIDEPYSKNGLCRFTVNVHAGLQGSNWQPIKGKLMILVHIPDKSTTIYQYGDQLLFNAAQIEVIPGPLNPGAFNYRKWLAGRNIYHQAFMEENELRQTGKDMGYPILHYAFNFRKQQVAVFRKLIKNDEVFALASTLILGYRTDLDDDTFKIYSKTGTVHALSVSGMHVGIIYFVLHKLLFFFNKHLIQRIAKTILICSFIWAYTLLTGFSPSALRSAIMLSVFILSKLFNRQLNNYNLLAFTAFCLLLHSPFLLWDMGFQLSFMAVWGLIYLQPKLDKWCYIKYRWANQIWSAITLSVAAQLATFPLSIYYFHQFPVYFLISNRFILLPVMLLMYSGISILLFGMHFLAPYFEHLFLWMNKGLNWIAHLPLSTIDQIRINLLQLIILSFGVFLLIYALSIYKKHFLLLAISLLLIFQASLCIKAIEAFHQRRIIFFSLGRHYATAFIYGTKGILITDLSYTDKEFQSQIQPALDLYHVRHTLCIPKNTDITISGLTKRGHQIYFQGMRILLLSPTFPIDQLANKPAFDILWISGYSSLSIYHLQDKLMFKQLIFDASNRAGLFGKMKAEINNFKIEAYFLKKNKAYLINLKK